MKTAPPSGLLGHYAGFASRAAALVLDCVIVAALAFVLYWAVALPLKAFTGLTLGDCGPGQLQSSWLRVALCAGVLFLAAAIALGTLPVYVVFFTMMTGQTVGMHVLGLRIVRLDGRHMTFRSSVIRFAGMIVSMFPLGIGYLWVLVDDRRQSFHDKLAGTCVIYAWRAEQNEVLVDRVRRVFHRRA
jgi:uncharacterized RDD family membrane protein YckC